MFPKSSQTWFVFFKSLQLQKGTTIDYKASQDQLTTQTLWAKYYMSIGLRPPKLISLQATPMLYNYNFTVTKICQSVTTAVFTWHSKEEITLEGMIYALADTVSLEMGYYSCGILAVETEGLTRTRMQVMDFAALLNGSANNSVSSQDQSPYYISRDPHTIRHLD